MLTFESASVLGVSSIVEKLSVRNLPPPPPLAAPRCAVPGLTSLSQQSLPFQKLKHQVSTLDAQPTMVDGCIVILVTGQLLVSNGSSSSSKQH